MELMGIPGPSGQEAAVRQYLQSVLEPVLPKRNWLSTDQAHRKTDPPGEVGNLILKLPGTRRGTRRLFSAHMDTVPLCVGCQPERRGKYVVSADSATGLGADDRAGTAVLLATALRLLSSDTPYPPITFLWTVQEEVGLKGARHVNFQKLGKPRWGFNFDGGDAAKITIGATGGYRMAITLKGIASHAGGAPEEGVSAIAIAAMAIADLQQNGWHGAVRKGRRIGTSNVGVVRGGQATNIVAEKVELEAEARSHDATFRKRIVKEIEQAFRRAAKQVTNTRGQSGKVEFEGRLDYESYHLRVNDTPAVLARSAVSSAGLDPEIAIANGGLDANWLTAHGVPTVTLGCGQMNIHTSAEKLDLPAFHQACEIAWSLATGEDPNEA